MSSWETQRPARFEASFGFLSSVTSPQIGFPEYPTRFTTLDAGNGSCLRTAGRWGAELVSFVVKRLFRAVVPRPSGRTRMTCTSIFASAGIL